MSKPDQHGNAVAQEGCDRCFCGCKYWENDRCVDCNTHVSNVICPGSGRLVNKYGQDIVTGTIPCPVCDTRVTMDHTGLNSKGQVSRHTRAFC
jgi:hypothetical protein